VLSALAQITPYKQALIDVGGHRMTALVFNQNKPGTPVIFLHGITSSIYFWAAGQSQYVQDNLRWYALSLPGHTPASFPADFTPEQLTAEHLADVTVNAIEKLVGDEPFIVVGHSTGGFMALNVAMRYPARVRAVVSVSGFVQGTWTGPLGQLQRYTRWGGLGRWLFKLNLRGTVINRAVYRYVMRYYAADAPAMYSSPMLEPTIDNVYPASRELDADAMHIWFNRMPDIDISAGLATIGVPLLVMVGDSDPIVPPAQAYLVHERVPGSELIVYPGCGHLPMAERERQYNADLDRWLKKILEQDNI
jgi:pimeloyl-ACP methyl ester carboxylesterase